MNINIYLDIAINDAIVVVFNHVSISHAGTGVFDSGLFYPVHLFLPLTTINTPSKSKFTKSDIFKQFI